VPETAVRTDVGFYFYGVVPAGTDVSGLRGLDDVEVEIVLHDGLAAVVSRLALERPPGRSAELVAHARVVDSLAASAVVVPAQFGLVLDHDLAEVARVIDDSADRFRALLERLDGRVQLNLRASYVPEQVLSELVQQDPAIADLRERTHALPAGTAHPDLVRLGESVSRGLVAKRLQDSELVLDVVLPYVEEHVLRPEGEYDVLDAALLVGRDQVNLLEQSLEGLAEVVHERLRLRLVGPVAPYDFVGGQSWG
jgi:Gas vesicle synthesis protein GvpL/GvpF